MAIKDELEQIAGQLDQLKAAIDVGRQLRNIYRRITVLTEKVAFYQVGAGFDDIPAETKAALTRFFQMCVQLKDAFENDPAFSVLISETVEPEAPPPLP
jgi:hypothetical protein